MILNLEGKRALIMGITNDRSIGLATLEAFRATGAEVAASTLPNLVERVKSKGYLPDSIPLFGCDVAGSDDQIIALAYEINKLWPEGFDYLLHSLAYSDRNELKGSILNTTRENYLKTQDISAYSLIAVCKHLGPLMRPGGAVGALTFAASRFRSPNYNTMAPAKSALETNGMYIAFDPLFAGRRITVNAFSASPIRTASSAGVEGFVQSMEMGAMRSAFGENATAEDVGHDIVLHMQLRTVTGSTIDMDNGTSHSGVGAGDTEYAYHKAHGPYKAIAEAAANAQQTEAQAGP